MTKDKIAHKIQALFAKARDEAATEAEARAAEAKASELMLKHAIEESDLGPINSHEPVHRVITLPVNGSGYVGTASISLHHVVARAHGCYAWFNPGQQTVLHLIGRPQVVDGVIALFGRLQVDMVAQASKLRAGEDDLRGWRENKASATRRLRSSFMQGYILEIERRLNELKRSVDAESDGGLLPVLANDLDRAKALAPSGLHTVQRKAQSGARDAGTAAGARAQLAGGAMPNARQALNA